MRQFQQTVDSLTTGRGKSRLDEFKAQLHGVRADLQDKSQQIYEMYWQVMAALLQMLALLAWVAFLAVFGFGGLGGLSEAIFNRARVAVLASIATLLQRVKVLPGVFEALEEALLSFAVQLGNKLFGNKLFRRNDLDWGSIGKDGLFGFFAGGIGEILGGAFHKGKDLLSKLGKNANDFGGVKNPPDFGQRVLKEADDNVNDFVSEGFGESLGAAAMGLFFEGFGFTWATFLGAGSSGVVERNLEHGAAGGASWLRNKFLKPPPTPDGVNSSSHNWPTRSANPDSTPNSNSDSGSSRNNDRSNGTNGRTGPRTDFNPSGPTRRPPLTTSNGDANGTGGETPPATAAETRTAAGTRTAPVTGTAADPAARRSWPPAPRTSPTSPPTSPAVTPLRPHPRRPPRTSSGAARARTPGSSRTGPRGSSRTRRAPPARSRRTARTALPAP